MQNKCILAPAIDMSDSRREGFAMKTAGAHLTMRRGFSPGPRRPSSSGITRTWHVGTAPRGAMSWLLSALQITATGSRD